MKKENNDKIIEEFYNRFADRPISLVWYLDVGKFLKQALTRQRQELKQEFRKIVKEVEARNPDSNGRYNMCKEILIELDKL